MPIRAQGLTATTLQDGRVLIVGGPVCQVQTVATPPGTLRRCHGDNLRATWIWSPDGTLVAGPELNDERGWHTATLLAGRARADRRQSAVGHRHARGRGGLRPGHEHVHPWSASRATTSRAPRRRRSFAMGACSSRAATARIPTSARTGSARSRARRPGIRRPGRSVARRRWSSSAAPTRPRSCRTAECWWRAGPAYCTSDSIDPSTPQTEVWDPATDAFQAGPTMADPRAQFTLTTLLDGSLLAIGGDARYDAAPRRRPPARHRRDPRPRPDELTIDGGRFAGRAPGSVRGGGRRAEDVEQRAHDEGAQGERERRGDELPVQRRFPRCRTSP